MIKKCLMVGLIALFILSALTTGSVMAAGQEDASQERYGPLPEDLPGQSYGDGERGPGPGPYEGYEWHSPDS